MPIISNPNNFFCEYHFVFSGNDILICNEQNQNNFLDIKNLPDEQILRKFFNNQTTSDWFAEPDLNYSALMLENESPLPCGCKSIALRDFFWRTKTAEEQSKGIPSYLGTLAARAHGLLRLRETHRFCPTCGKKLEDDTEFSAKVCPACKRQFFPRIEPAVIVLVSKGNEVLLVKNKNRKYDTYACVSGFVELGETLEQAVKREVLEETGICIKNIRYTGSQSWPFPDQLMLAFLADYESGEIKIQESELDDAKWFSRDNLPEIPKRGSVAHNLIMGFFN